MSGKDREPIVRSGRAAREKREEVCEHKEKTLSEKAAGIFLVLGSAVILLFLCFGGKNEGADMIYYENSSNVEYSGAVQAMSYVLYGEEENGKEENADGKGKNKNSESAETSSANAENSGENEGKSWNFWEFLSQSFEKFFISKGIISDERSQR